MLKGLGASATKRAWYENPLKPLKSARRRRFVKGNKPGPGHRSVFSEACATRGHDPEAAEGAQILYVM